MYIYIYSHYNQSLQLKLNVLVSPPPMNYPHHIYKTSLGVCNSPLFGHTESFSSRGLTLWMNLEGMKVRKKEKHTSFPFPIRHCKGEISNRHKAFKGPCNHKIVLHIQDKHSLTLADAEDEETTVSRTPLRRHLHTPPLLTKVLCPG